MPTVAPSALLAVLLVASASVSPAQTTVPRKLEIDSYRDKVRGAWAGKMVGVAVGFPTEFKFRGELVPDSAMPAWQPEMIRGALNQDDLYVQMAFAQVLDDRGLDAKLDDFAAAFRESQFPVWHASQAARRALRRGASPLESGTPKFNAHGNDIAFQINADFIGLMCPGMPEAANELCYRVARMLAWGNGIYGGMFTTGMYAEAFFESDPRKVVMAGLASLPPDCEYAKVIADVLAWSAEHPSDWKKTWARVNEKWDHQDRCPYGALEPMNIDAKLNGAYLAIGLLYGENDFWKTIDVATRCGQDSDCNPSTAAGIWGAMHGFSKIPEQYTSGLPAIAAEKFVFTQYTFDSIVQSTVDRGTEMAKKAGGQNDGHQLVFKPQLAKPAPLPEYSIGNPVERVSCDDKRWTWTGDWKREVSPKSGPERVATQQGSEAVIQFDGTGVIICGPYVPNGGRADVIVDDLFKKTIDVADDDGRRKVMESVWHAFDLPPGKHTLKLVLRGERYGASKGTEVRVHSLIVYR